MFTTALEWQVLLSLLATPALLTCHRLKGKLLVKNSLSSTSVFVIMKLISLQFHYNIFKIVPLDADTKALLKERQKKDNHNLSKSASMF